MHPASQSALGAAIILSAITSAFAHHPDASAGGGSGPIGTISASTLEQGQGAVAFIEQYIKFTNFDFNWLGANQHAHNMKFINNPAVAVAYGVTDDLTFAMRFPYVIRDSVVDGHKHGNPLAPPHVTNLGNSEGFGDVTVLGQYRFFNNQASGTEAAVLFGVKAPTGRTDRITSEGDLFEAEFQPGSGSWDGLLGLALSQRFGSWSFHASVLYTLTGTGTQDTNLGDRAVYGIAAAYRLIGEVHTHAPGTPPHTHAPSFALDGVIELNGEWQARQFIANMRDDDSGGNVIYLSPGLRASYGSVGGFLSVGIPVVKHLNGNQAPPDYRVLAGMSYAFGH